MITAREQTKDISKFIDYKFIKYLIPVAPQTAPRMVRSDKWAKRPPVVRYFAYRDELQLFTRNTIIAPDGVLDIIFVVPFPDSYSEKKKQSLYMKKHELKPDRDNLLKGFQDAIFRDDAHIWDGRTIKLWGYYGCIIIF